MSSLSKIELRSIDTRPNAALPDSMRPTYVACHPGGDRPETRCAAVCTIAALN